MALDVTQGVFEGLLRRDLRTLDLERGKRFRAWLRRVALSHLCNVFKQRSRVSARERSMDQLLGAGAEIGADDETERAFDRHAAEVLVERAWQQLRQEAGEELRLFEHIRRSLMWEETELSDLELCRALGKSDSYVRVNRNRLKEADFPRALRAELARVGVSKRHMNDELRALLDALA
ncbi:MAG: hypothetical protein QM756_35085 [Polyangiaceae bacterium]